MTLLPQLQDAIPPNRAEGVLRARFARHGGRTRAMTCHEAGGLRLRFPKVDQAHEPDCEAVCINTGGGMVGGDRARLSFGCDPGAAVSLTTQSAEKIYRSTGALTKVEVSLDVASQGCLEWLPQETILFDQVRLSRTLDIAMRADASLLMVEMLVFGRLAMGETVRSGELHDRWRIRRDGRLLFAEDLRLAGDIASTLDRPALGGGARALATLLFVAPQAESMLDPVRAALAGTEAESGASAWNGLLSFRALSPSPERLRRTIVTVLEILRGRAVPRVWQ
ncbi:urease accessory protein UreD [Lichenifustis flavocetrariae]|uniref:Urease accessory protein UreD n=1 Tax=Lichenifustis flavocetrariae TaxID=2949735 RepID=A0AA41YV67_9HYPH|nr:urease accessory protein UreD [Lichenifustis flavocetrariae]MCW6508724.1 urease accessory protein UreD [Lichenifustis flavocetrariae]